MKKYAIYSILGAGIIVWAFLLIGARAENENNNPIALSAAAVDANPAPSAIVAPETSRPFTILLVPGHDTDTDCKNQPCNKGAVFKKLYERDLVVDVADDIAALFADNPGYKVIIARDKEAWNPIFSDYFSKNEQAITDFKNAHQIAYQALIDSGKAQVVADAASHSTADPKTSLQLYGINKWVGENDVDLIIHLHFNSSGRKNMNMPGPYRGFNIFVPEKNRANAPDSKIVAEDIYKELENKFKPEAPGNYKSLFEDQSLIALGSSNTLDKPAILIEYAYIYEKMLQSNASRDKALADMADLTAAGIKDYASSINNQNQ